LILLLVSYSLISFNFYLFYFPGAAAEPLGSAHGALRAPRSTGWEPLPYCITISVDTFQTIMLIYEDSSLLRSCALPHVPHL